MTTQRKPKTVTIPQAEYSAPLGVVAAHRADSGKAPSKVLEHFDSVARKPKVDRGGRMYLVKHGKVWEARKGGDCSVCPHKMVCGDGVALLLCDDQSNGGRGYRTLHPVHAVS